MPGFRVCGLSHARRWPWVMHDITVKRVIAAVGLVLAAIAFLGAVTTGFASPAWVLPSAVLCLAAVLVV